MGEFIQDYWIWILIIGGMFLMRRLGIGCCGGHRHRPGREHAEPGKSEPKPAEAKTASEREEERAAAQPVRGFCH